MLADVKPGRYLEAGNPTGLTGLFTHPAPRTALLYTYGATLDKLKNFPDYSVYRQSTEALTKHRMNIIESIKPKGYDEWAAKAKEKREKYPEAFEPGGEFFVTTAGGQEFVDLAEPEPEPKIGYKPQLEPNKKVKVINKVLDQETEDYDFYKEDVEEFGVEEDEEEEPELVEAEAEVENRVEKLGSRPDYIKLVDWQPEPPLEASQCVKNPNPLDIIATR